MSVDKKTTTAAPSNYAHIHEQARARLLLAVMVLLLGYLAVGLRLVDLTLLRGDAHAPVVAAAPVMRTPPGLRAPIVDRNGEPLAMSLKMASVYVDATMVDQPKELASQLAKIIPEQSHKSILEKLTSGRRFIWLQRNITPRQQYAINALGVPALGFQEEERRVYPDAELAAHVVGYTDVDGRGIAGIERSFDQQLREGKDPVRLTIDLRVQHMLRRELSKAVSTFKAKAAVGVVLDAETGEVVAMVSLPDFDPNHAGSAPADAKFNRATLGVFEMGSTFKLFSIAAALEKNKAKLSTVIDATDPIRVGRFAISDYHGKKRPLTVPEIFIYSSNIGTAKLAQAVGSEEIQDFYRSLGFMSRPQVELPERGAPLYPAPWREVSTMTTSFGHGMAVTPLHLVRATAGLVNGGHMPSTTLIAGGAREDSVRVVSARTSDQVRQLMELTVSGGTSGKAWVDGYNVGGKTGTAEKSVNGRYAKKSLLSSFIGVFPVQSPRYVVLAMIDEPQGIPETHGYATGGWTAAPVAARVIEQMAPLYGMAPDYTRTRQDSVREMSVYLKEKKGGSTVATAGVDR